MYTYLSSFEGLFRDVVSVLYLAWAYNTVLDNLIVQYRRYRVNAKVPVWCCHHMVPNCITLSLRKEGE